MVDGVLERWLMEADPAVRWQVLRDVLHAPDLEVAEARARVADSGWGAQLLQLQQSDGQWGAGIYDGDSWDSTTDALCVLRELGIDPTDEQVRQAVDSVDEHVRWEERNGGRPFFSGETEACVNGRVAALGAYFGRPNPDLIERLRTEQLADGGWNCDAPTSSRSSFHSTICVLEGLLEFEHATAPSATLADARHRGEEYLLDRGLLRGKVSGRLIDPAWLDAHFPVYWCYDLLRGLDYLRAAGRTPDPRADEALSVLRTARLPDGAWTAAPHEGRPVIELEPAGRSRWATLRALRVLEWAGAEVVPGHTGPAGGPS